MAADALTPGVTRSSAAMVLTVPNKLVLVFFKEDFYTGPALTQCWEMREMQTCYHVSEIRFSMTMVEG